MKGKSRIILAFCLSILTLLIIGSYAYRSADNHGNESAWVDHTYKVISEMQNVLLDVQKIETAQRGYVITGEDKYLEPYFSGIDELELAFKSIHSLVKDNAEQGVLLDRIQTTTNSKIDFAGQVVELRRNNGYEDAKELVATNIGENMMKKIRTLVTVFIQNERILLSERLGIAKSSLSLTLKVIIFSIVITILILLAALYFFLKDHNMRLRTEHKLLESEFRIKGFLSALPVGVFVVNSEGRPYYANEKSEEILGKGLIPDVSLKEMPELYKVFVAGTDTTYPSERQPVARALMGESQIGVEDMEVEKNGVRIPLRINASSIKDLEGNIDYAIAVFEDVTDVRETQKKLIAATQLAEKSSLLKETFLANMSHEIRTPMNAIIGFTDLMLKRSLDEQATDYVRTIKTAAENLLRIINDVLDVSKIESGMMTFESHPISIKELFTSLQSMLFIKAKEKKLELSFACGPNLPESLLGDPTRLTQIILNLVGNAIKFTREGKVEVSARLVDYHNETYRVEFTIKDTGIGIPAKKLDEIFERFTQAESHTTRHYGGTGLGLNIAKQLVELQGGTISVSSEVNKGSVFTFILPFQKTKEEFRVKENSISLADPVEFSNKSILVVEDNPVNVKFITGLFAGYGIKPDLAENGKIAVEKVRSRNYDVVLMDLEMPEMNGYEATAIIRNELKSKVPIIAMTAHAMAGEKEKCLQIGMNEYVPKPIREKVLFEKMFNLSINQQPSTPDKDIKEQVIDLDFLIRSMRGNNDAILETIDTFLTTTPEDMDYLFAAIKKENLSAVKRTAHRLKSSLSLMGSSKGEALLEEMEVLAIKHEDFPRIKELSEVLAAEYEAIIEALTIQKYNYNK